MQIIVINALGLKRFDYFSFFFSIGSKDMCLNQDDTPIDDQIIPIAGRVLIKLPPNEKKEVKGLVHLEQDLGYCQEGTVIAVGAGRMGKKGNRVPIECKIGQKVYITRFAGIQVMFDGQPCLMCFSEDVLAVMN